jgi:multisubunit Na+/H+ antiporter MnhB subunit
METAAIIFILIMFGVAYIAFRILKRTLKMAIRAIVVLLILIIAVVGGVALWNMDGKDFIRETPVKTKKSR